MFKPSSVILDLKGSKDLWADGKSIPQTVESLSKLAVHVCIILDLDRYI